MQLRRYGMSFSTLINDGAAVIESGLANTPVISGLFDNGRVNACSTPAGEWHRENHRGRLVHHPQR